jgi:hypothetical protein
VGGSCGRFASSEGLRPIHIGYTRNVVRPDGKLVSVYYYNFDEHGPRSIEATI